MTCFLDAAHDLGTNVADASLIGLRCFFDASIQNRLIIHGLVFANPAGDISTHAELRLERL